MIIGLILAAIPIALLFVGFRMIFKPWKTVVAYLAATPIVLFAGHNGAGKTWLASQVRATTLEGSEGTWKCSEPEHRHTARGVFEGRRQVLSTLRLTDPNAILAAGERRPDHSQFVPWKHALELVDPDLEHADVFVDEAVLHGLDGRQSQSMPIVYRRLLQQLRKRDLTFHCTIPSVDFVDKTLRTVAMTYVECRSFMGKKIPGTQWKSQRLMLVKVYNAKEFSQWTDGARREAKPMFRTLIWRPGKVADRLYSTLEDVEPVAGFDELGKCSHCGGKPRASVCKCENPTLLGVHSHSVPAPRDGSAGTEGAEPRVHDGPPGVGAEGAPERV